MASPSADIHIDVQPHQVSEREMSQGVHEPVSVCTSPEEGIDSDSDHIVPSQTVDPPAQTAATFIDGSNLLFSMYNEVTVGHDWRVVENWNSDADSAVVANGLFSVVVAILLGRSYQDLRLNSQDVSAFYLSQIYQQSVGQNTTTPLPFKVSDPSTFSPAPSSVRASALWSLSLVISLASMVIATLLRQWARRYLRITQEPHGPHNRARIRELVTQGVEMKQLQHMSSVLPGLFHLSVFLFLSGLIHSSNNSTVDLVILVIASSCIGLYFFASLISLSSFFNIVYTPLSSFAWFLWSRIVSLTYKLLYSSSIRLPFIGYRTQYRFWESARAYLSQTFRSTAVDMEDLIRKRSSSLDTSVVSRLFDSLDGHEDMERFLSAIPGFYNSSEVTKDILILEGLNDRILAPAITLFMDRSLSSNILTEPNKQQRIAICLQAMNADPLLLQCTFWQALQTLNSDIFKCVDFVRFALEHLHSNDSDPWVKDYARCIVAVAISHMPLDDGAWVDVAWRYLKPQHTQYLWERHNLRLCSLIYLTRQLKDSRLENSNQFKQGGIWRTVLAVALKLEILKTAPGLQLEFCAVLDELRSMASDGEQPSEMARSNAGLVLSIIRTAFTPLHKGTAAFTIASSSSKGDQGPVLQWLTSCSPRSTRGVGTRADLGVAPIAPTNILEDDHPQDTVPEATYVQGPYHEIPSHSDVTPSYHYIPPHASRPRPHVPPSLVPDYPYSRHTAPEAPYAYEPRHETRSPSPDSDLPSPRNVPETRHFPPHVLPGDAYLLGPLHEMPSRPHSDVTSFNLHVPHPSRPSLSPPIPSSPRFGPYRPLHRVTTTEISYAHEPRHEMRRPPEPVLPHPSNVRETNRPSRHVSFLADVHEIRRPRPPVRDFVVSHDRPPTPLLPPPPIHGFDHPRPWIAPATYAHEPRSEVQPPSLHSDVTLFRLLRLPFNSRRTLP
ncbi:hypothetical protein H4582DRAFT_2197701 [Lactarius indigo]|nr:hypothetical protein H4582DRAFT_2197701 [Lactarius indigo]